MDRCIELVIAILGVLKAGGCYVPIDPANPKKRIDYLIENSKCSLILAQPNTCKMSDLYPNSFMVVARERWENERQEFKLEPIVLEQLAYIIFTSGSTGNPKGVKITHKGLANYLNWAIKSYDANTYGNFLLYSSLSFDLTVTSLFLPLLTGNTIYVQPAERVSNLLEV
jgi:non-ribosomal peptide synthetase component F